MHNVFFIVIITRGRSITETEQTQCKARNTFTTNVNICSINIKTESIRKLSNFDCQWTKALYQNNLNNIAFFFIFFKGYRQNYLSAITPKTISHWSPRKQMSNSTRIVKTQVKFWKFHVEDVILWNLTFIFSGSHKNFSLMLLQITNYIHSPWKIVKLSCLFLWWKGSTPGARASPWMHNNV